METILVVDDEDALRRMVGRRLRRNYEVIECATGTEALAALESRDVDLVVSDFHMPEMSGLELFQQLKQRARDVDFILMTAYADIGTAVEGFRLGASDYLQKPFEQAHLDNAVERALTQRRLRRKLGLYEATQAIFSSTNNGSATLPMQIVDITKRTMAADEASLMLARDGVLESAYSSNPALRDQAISLRFGERVAGRVAVDRKPVLLNTPVDQDPRFKDVTPSQRVRSSIVHPLMSRGEILGVLNISRVTTTHGFSATDLERAGVLAGLVSLALDNGQLMEALQQKVAALEQFQGRLAASERLAGIGFLAASVVHEINNPIACVLGNMQYLVEELEQLQRDQLPVHSEALSAAKDTCDAAVRIREIALDMRRLSRSERGEGSLLDIQDPIRSALRLAGAEIRGRAEVEVELAPELTVRGHGGPLTQVFLNLLINAVHAVREKPAGASKQVRVVGRRTGNDVVVEVRDTGVGMSPAVRARIFEPLFTTKPDGQGTGLGLTLCREIIQNHGGGIEVESTEGVGTTFRVRLPSAAPVQNQAAAPAASQERLRVLLIDDDASVVDALRRVLARDHEVTGVLRGEDAVQLLEAGGFDVILCDLLMPKLTGLELFQRIAARPEIAGRFVFMTGPVVDPGLRQTLTQLGRLVLEKPIDPEILTATVRTVAAAAAAPSH